MLATLDHENTLAGLCLLNRTQSTFEKFKLPARPVSNTTGITTNIVVCGVKPSHGRRKQRLNTKTNTETKWETKRSTTPSGTWCWPLKLSALLLSTKWTTAQKSSPCSIRPLTRIYIPVEIVTSHKLIVRSSNVKKNYRIVRIVRNIMSALTGPADNADIFQEMSAWAQCRHF